MSISPKSMLGSNLEGQLLIAMPGMTDERFHRSVVFMCAHSDEGAMGLIINKHAPGLKLGALLAEMDLGHEDDGCDSVPDGGTSEQLIHMGGPVETERGFVLHSSDYFAKDATVEITDGICLTATTDVLAAMATGTGPRTSILALGYAGWSGGQLEDELGANGWLNCAADPDLVFGPNIDAKYDRALFKLGVDPSHLVGTAGRA